MGESAAWVQFGRPTFGHRSPGSKAGQEEFCRLQARMDGFQLGTLIIERDKWRRRTFLQHPPGLLLKSRGETFLRLLYSTWPVKPFAIITIFLQKQSRLRGPNLSLPAPFRARIEFAEGKVGLPKLRTAI